MAKNTSILLGDYFDDFINQHVKTELINELKRGEKSGFVNDFNRESFLITLL